MKVVALAECTDGTVPIAAKSKGIPQLEIVSPTVRQRKRRLWAGIIRLKASSQNRTLLLYELGNFLSYKIENPSRFLWSSTFTQVLTGPFVVISCSSVNVSSRLSSDCAYERIDNFEKPLSLSIPVCLCDLYLVLH